MGIFDFIKNAGEKLFHSGEAKAAQEAATADASPDKIAAANSASADAIQAYISKMGLVATNLAVEVDSTQGLAKVSGEAADQTTREKIVLCCGNVNGVEKVEDNMTVQAVAEESQWHTVVSGDTLSAIAKTHYGNANLYNAIFEANKPMLSDPNKIYPGQKLRIPPKG